MTAHLHHALQPAAALSMRAALRAWQPLATRIARCLAGPRQGAVGPGAAR